MQATYIVAAIGVSPVILNVCFIALMVLGVYVVAKVIAHPPRGGESEFSLLGSQVKVKGPAWLIMLVVGALMVGSPLIAAASQQSSITPFEPTKPADRVKKVPEPNYTSFTFANDLSVLDLRRSFEQPWYTRLPGFSRWRGTHVRIRPAILTNTMVVKKIAPADFIYIKYSTTGALDLRCLTHPYTTQLSEKSDEGQVIADVRSVGVGEEFTIITEVTYWNAFRGAAGDDFTTYTHNQQNTQESIALAIIFPDDQPFKSMQILEQPPQASTMRLASSGTPWQSPGNETFYWATRTPGGEWFFTAKWTW
jgi:hypothetical protein